MSAARWTALCALAYNLCHHLGALPGGLGAAGGGTRWVDWLDLLTPYAVVGTALAALAAAGTDRRGWAVALVGGVAYVQGHGLHLSANSISNARGDGAPVALWDERVGHWLWYAGVALLAVALVRALRPRPGPVAVLLAVASGLTWTTNALEGAFAAGGLVVALALTAWGVRRRDAVLLAAFGTSAGLLLAYGLWQGGFPPPTSL